ncbi:MAG: hypothetical protein UZ19_OD1000867 [Parcubacteria bacterium OLB19]|nr:MAG: hypothetical protein UZ19_OD1000867 [Parcubacteria bacterium OLB19]
MLAGVISGSLFGPIIGILSAQIVGLFIGILSTIFSRMNIIFVFISGFTGWYAGLFTGLFTGVPNGITNLTTLQWFGFCIVIIEIEYAIVLYRRHLENKKLLAIT